MMIPDGMTTFTAKQIREIKAQIAGETRAREAAQAKIEVERNRADKAERAQRELAGALSAAKRDLEVCQAVLRSAGLTLPGEYDGPASAGRIGWARSADHRK